jgi:hypothetical protein
MVGGDRRSRLSNQRSGGNAMSDEVDPLIKAACLQAAAGIWANTALNHDGTREPQEIADRIAQLASMLLDAWQKHDRR